MGINLPDSLPSDVPLIEKEEILIQQIAEFAVIVKLAGDEYNPALLANYAYDLVKEYNQFYHDYSILREDDKNIRDMRLVLSDNVGRIIKKSMKLLGIEVPDRM